MVAPILSNYDSFVREEIRDRIGSGMRRGLTSGKQTGVFRHLPYTLDDLFLHLGKSMPDGYSWGDLADMHIDHIQPVSSFDIKEIGDEEFMRCWALDNLQLLSAEDNMRKGAKLDWEAE